MYSLFIPWIMFFLLGIFYLLCRYGLELLQRTYRGEIAISFHPYISIIDLLVIVISFVFLLCTKKKKIQRLFPLICGIILFIRSDLSVLFLEKQAIQENQHKENQQLTFLYANILKSNTNYSGILSLIEKNDPDVILFVEYEKKHQNTIRPNIEKKYPYKNRDIGAKDYFGNMIFSKYPLVDLTKNIKQEARRYGYVSIEKDKKKYIIYLVHTSAPISKKHFTQRNEQLNYLAESFREQYQKQQEIPLMMLGDFNTTPRSSYYTLFLEKTEKKLKNMSIYNAFSMTRAPLLSNFPKAHIDHVFVSTGTIVTKLQKIDIPGSDHDGYVGAIE